MSTSRSEGTAQRILVVEDETVVALHIQDILLEGGYAAPWIATDLHQVMAVLRDQKPDVAVVDLNLGGESGVLVADALEARGVPFVFATGYGRRAVPEKWRTKIVVQKPFLPEALVAAIRAAQPTPAG